MANKILDGDQMYVLEGSQCYQIEQHAGPMDDHPLWICKYLVEGPEIISAMHSDFLHEKRKQGIVGGSAGPYGATLHDGSEYTGAYIDTMCEEMLMDWHRPRVKALADAEVDFIAFETLPSVVEGRAVVRLMREFPNSKAWVSFNCKDQNSTARGEAFGQCISECWNLSNGDLYAVGLNCTQPFCVSDLLKQVPATPKMPLLIYPNSGEVFQPGLGWTGTSMDLGSLAPEWIRFGAKFLGGCCRSRVSDIVGIRAAVDAVNAAS